jgi:hypothetical protein
MERSSASAGSGIFWCRSGCRPGGGGGLILKWVPIRGGRGEILSVARYFQYSAAESAHSWPVNLAGRALGLLLGGVDVAYAFTELARSYDVGKSTISRLTE